MDRSAPTRDAVSQWASALHDELTSFFEGFEPSARFQEDPWTRPGGGGGWTRVLEGGDVFEKAGVNRAEVTGVLDARLAGALLTEWTDADPPHFYATGVSIVCHPRNPHVSIVHENVRYFELRTAGGEVRDRWFGGGLDLTPTYPHPEDARHFHGALHTACSPYGEGVYEHAKATCDRYFVNTHRGGEARGVGGIFFDHLRPGGRAVGRDWTGPEAFAFVQAVGRSMIDAYGPIVERRVDLPYGDAERSAQLWRRGRYVEFNLVHDRGTKFGLESSARIESVLMSLPPLAAWPYDPPLSEGSIERGLLDLIRPRDWLADDA